MNIQWPRSWLIEDWPQVYNTGVTEPWTQAVAAAILRASGKHDVLELGSYLGHTTVWLADVLEYSADPMPWLTAVELDPERVKATREKLQRMSLGFNWTVCQEDTIVYLKGCKPHSIDFVWLDDDHNADHVAEELELLIKPNQRDLGIVKPGGIVLMHDVYGPHALGGVCSRYGGICLDFPKLGSDGGIGIIQL